MKFTAVMDDDAFDEAISRILKKDHIVRLIEEQVKKAVDAAVADIDRERRISKHQSLRGQSEQIKRCVSRKECTEYTCTWH